MVKHSINQEASMQAKHVYVMQQSSCLIVNPVMLRRFGFLYNCMMVVQSSDSMMALNLHGQVNT